MPFVRALTGEGGEAMAQTDAGLRVPPARAEARSPVWQRTGSHERAGRRRHGRARHV